MALERFLNAGDVQEKKALERWRMDQRLLPTQVFLDHITNSILQYYFDTNL